MSEQICDRCGSEKFVNVPIHNGSSVRRDCLNCGRTIDFPTWHGRDTRAVAAAKIAPRVGRLQRQVFDLVKESGQRGATDYEIHAALKMLPDTARARRCELVKAGAIVASNQRRPSPAGCPMTVWITTPEPWSA